MEHDTDVLVVGAGMAGITTAWALRQVGIRTILLEARPRIGGRIHSSYKWKDLPVDLGASWVSHGLLNPLVDLARANKIKLTASDLFNISLFEPRGDGTPMPEDRKNALMAAFFGAYAEVKLESEKRRKRGKPDIGLDKVFPNVIDSLKLPKKAKRGVEYFLNMAVTEPFVSDLDDLSLYNWDDDYTLMSMALYVVPDGYVKIAEVLAKRLDIRKEHVVSKILRDDEGVTIKTDRGDFRAPYAVVTLPHGVLRKKSVKFSPPLPPWKQQAIDRVHTGLSDKFWFRFPTKFWESDSDILGRIDPDGQGRWSTWINAHKFTKQPLLMVFNRNEHAEALEKMSDKDVIAEAMNVLRGAYGEDIPEPIAMQRSKWLADPFSEGTLVHLPPGATSEDHRTLGRPVGRLRFAGDSTQPEFPCMVLGAFLSGLREAEKLTELIAMEKLTAG
jgi:monoamine oxidase